MLTLLSIGELSSRTGVATSALRYDEKIGLVRPVKRVSQQRRYNESAVDSIGVVPLLRDVGFTLAEVKTMTSSKRAWTGLAKRKLDELQQKLFRPPADIEQLDPTLAAASQAASFGDAGRERFGGARWSTRRRRPLACPSSASTATVVGSWQSSSATG